jgi:beta-phosphoglucomutase
MKRAIIFDFDGVIINSEQSRYNVISDICSKNSIILKSEKVIDIAGKTTRLFLETYVTPNDKSIIDGLIEQYNREYKDNIINYINPIMSTCAFLRKCNNRQKFALVTMSDKKVVDIVLDYLKLDNIFKTIITKDMVISHKPNPECYLLCLQKLGLVASECVVIEDSRIGAEAANLAGIDCFVVMNGSNSVDDFIGINIAGYINEEDYTNIV